MQEDTEQTFEQAIIAAALGAGAPEAVRDYYWLRADPGIAFVQLVHHGESVEPRHPAVYEGRPYRIGWSERARILVWQPVAPE